MIRLNSRGQALIEVLFAVPIVAIVIGAGFYLMYLGYAQVWITRSAREAAACLVSHVPQTRCRAKLEATLKTGLLFGRAEIDVFRVEPDRSNVHVSVDAHSKILTYERLPLRLTAKSSFPRHYEETSLE